MDNQPKNNQAMSAKDTPNQSNSPRTFTVIKSVSAWVMIISATLFGIVGVLGVWEVFGQDNDVVWRSLSSLAIVAFSSLIVNVGARIALTKEH